MQVFAMGEHLLQISGIGGGFVRWQVGTGDVFSFGEAALQADDKREVLPYPGIDRMLGGGATKRGFGFAQVL